MMPPPVPTPPVWRYDYEMAPLGSERMHALAANGYRVAHIFQCAYGQYWQMAVMEKAVGR